MQQEDLEVLQDVLLLAIAKKEQQENIDDVVLMLIDGGVFDKKEAKVILDSLQKNGAISENNLTFIGNAMALKAKEKFTL